MCRVVWFVLGGVVTLVGGVIAKSILEDHTDFSIPKNTRLEELEPKAQDIQKDEPINE